MSVTAEILMFQTRPITVTGMVQQIMRKREIMPRHRLVTPDDIPTEIITQIVYGDDVAPRGRRRAKHRDRTAAYPRPRNNRMARHEAIPFKKPTTLTELWHHDELQDAA